MDNITIRKATMEDLTRLLEIYEYAKGFMARTGNPNQWRTGGPNRERLTKDIELEQLYVMESTDRIHASFMFSLAGEPDYAVIEDGSWRSDEPYGVIHRIAGDGTIHGVLQRAVTYAEQFNSHLRIDTHQDNKVMQGAIAKNGFVYCGIIHLADGSPRLAYEKL